VVRQVSGAPAVAPRTGPGAVGLAFAAGAFVVAAWDLISLSVNDDGAAGFGMLRYSLQLLVSVPCAAGLAAAGIAWAVGLSLRPGIARIPRRIAALLLVSAPLLTLLPPLFGGPAISSCPWRYPLAIASAALAVLLVGSLARATKATLERVASGPSGGLAAFAFAGAAVCALVGARELSAGILVGLYPDLHRAVTLAALAAVSCGALVALAALRRAPGRRTVLAMAIVALVSWAPGSRLALSAPLARQRLAEQAPLVGPFVGPLFSLESRVSAWLSKTAGSTGGRRGGSPFPAASFEGERRRSVVLVTVDALRGDVLDPGADLARRAPGLGRLARRGLRFERAYAPGNYTPVSVPAMVVGYHPGPKDVLAAGDTVFAPFNAAGYSTEFFFTAHEYASLERTSLWPLASKGFFCRLYHPEYRGAAAILEGVERSLAGPGPAFVWAHLSDVHSPFLLRADTSSRAGAFEGTYAGQLEHLDGVLAPFLERLIERRPEVIWALSSDHGESLGERGITFHGSNLYEEQVRVPLVIGGPGVVAGTVARPVGVIDLGSTLLSLAGATVPPWGPVLPTAPSADPRTPAPVLVVGRSQCGLVDGSHKLIVDTATGAVGLYDLRADPGETGNLVEDDGERARDMLGRLRAAACPYPMGHLGVD